ncbi:hypothetical protein [Zavarzinia compransoris]|nr:hypothetical protein [Zavarzinia compransoris]TDP45011.1 hypothetical protein DES42_106233 [Zavarzinia compransoris]
MRPTYVYGDSHPALLPQAQDRQIGELLMVLQRLSETADFGLVDREASRLELGVSSLEFEALVRRTRQRGYIDTQLAYGRLSLTLRGREKLSALYR